jgi:hypothetical protein
MLEPNTPAAYSALIVAWALICCGHKLYFAMC